MYQLVTNVPPWWGIVREAVRAPRQEVHGKSLNLPPNFSVSLKLL